ncbi:MAG: Gfo/Idh/MocA family protein [Haloarculaceae archaeon]
MTTAIGILSAEHLHADAYAACLEGMEDAELVGVADTEAHADSAGEKAEEYGVDALSVDDLLARSDGVAICSENVRHRELVEAAADAGVDVLCEKPLAPTVEDAQACVDACEAAGVHLGVALPLRFSEPMRNANQAVEEGTLGELTFLSGTNRGQMPGGWFADPELAGGGATMDHTVHILDAVRWITGRDVEEVYLESDTRFHDIPVEDVNLLSMRLEGGLEFTLDGSWSKPDEYDTWGGASLRLVGRDGVLEVDCFDQTLKQTRDSGAPGVHQVFWGPDANLTLVEDFVEAVREDRPPGKTGAHAVHDVAVIQAAYESAERGEPVQVER